MSMLRRMEVEACCHPRLREHLDLFWWLIWLPLLTRTELARVSLRNERTLWTHLATLSRMGLIAPVIFDEPGAARQHHYHLTDLGLHTLVALDPHPISAYKLAVHYPITRADLT